MIRILAHAGIRQKEKPSLEGFFCSLKKIKKEIVALEGATISIKNMKKIRRLLCRLLLNFVVRAKKIVDFLMRFQMLFCCHYTLCTEIGIIL